MTRRTRLTGRAVRLAGAALASLLGLAALLPLPAARADSGSAAPADSGLAAPADSAPAAPGSPTPAEPAPRAARFDPGLDRDRVELGGGLVNGYFDAVGSLGYRRYVRERRGWTQFAMGELSGTSKGYLTEGTASLYYFFRHRRTWHPEQRVNPLLEAGPGLHLAVQSAHLYGFNERPFHARLLLKAHVYVGVEALLSPRTGILLRGRMSIPEHRPLDYAQAAIFFR